MKLSFLGADREVTGSCHGLEANGLRVLVDCGMIQGKGGDRNQAFAFEPEQINAVVLTHAHIDHSGRLPLLTKRGFHGKIHATRATCDLLGAMLLDSAHIQESDAKWASKKNRRAGKAVAEPLYTIKDAEACLKQLVAHEYGERVQLGDGLSFTFVDAGHLMGSAYALVDAEENGIKKRIAFSGDIGNVNQPIIRDPSYLHQADYAIMESTYGDRVHGAPDDVTVELAKIIDKTLARGGNVIVPAFAVGRAQELLYYIRDMKQRKLVPSQPNFQVYLDSPLAAETTEIFDRNLRECADDQTEAVVASGADPIKFHGLHIIESQDQSMALNDDPDPKVIIASSGMCEAGRIQHHLKHNLWRTECSVAIVGFQAEGTVGRKLVDGEDSVRLLGEQIKVCAEVHNFRGMSGHADRDGLMKWIQAFDVKPARVFVVHGEAATCDVFAGALKDAGFSPYVPKFEGAYDLLADRELAAGADIGQPAEEAHEPTGALARLTAAGQRLMSLIKGSKAAGQGEMDKLAREINELCRKWEP